MGGGGKGRKKLGSINQKINNRFMVHLIPARVKHSVSLGPLLMLLYAILWHFIIEKLVSNKAVHSKVTHVPVM